jgi:competence protein ComEC
VITEQLVTLQTSRTVRHASIWVTGSNIAIVAGLLMLVGTKGVGKRRAVPLALEGIALYTLLAGADDAVVRAAIMG